MKVSEYQDKFNKLFKELEQEHGNLSCVEIISKKVRDESGNFTISESICKVFFAND